MDNLDRSEEGRVQKPMSRRKQKRAAKKLERAQSERVRTQADAAVTTNKLERSEGGRVQKPVSRRHQKKAAKKLERGQSDRARTQAEAAIHNARAARFRQTLRRPRRGGLTPQGAELLQRFFSKKVPKTEKPSLGDLDEPSRMVLLQMASEDVDAGKLTSEDLRHITEQTLMAKGAADGGEEEEEGSEGSGESKEVMSIEDLMEVDEGMGAEAEQMMGDEDEEQGGVALANDL